MSKKQDPGQTRTPAGEEKRAEELSDEQLDEVSGGKRQHTSIMVTKELDSSSPLLFS